MKFMSPAMLGVIEPFSSDLRVLCLLPASMEERHAGWRVGEIPRLLGVLNRIFFFFWRRNRHRELKYFIQSHRAVLGAKAQTT